jgi:branched-chain amino acid transport system ATP-binding protein
VHWCWSGDSHSPRCRLATTIFKHAFRLAPIIRRQIRDVLATLKSAGQSILVVDKNTMVLVRLADHHVILAKGQVVWQGDIPALWASKDLTARFLGA